MEDCLERGVVVVPPPLTAAAPAVITEQGGEGRVGGRRGGVGGRGGVWARGVAILPGVVRGVMMMGVCGDDVDVYTH